MLIWMFLAVIGLGLGVLGFAGVGFGLATGKVKLIIVSLIIPLLFAVGFYVLWKADQRFIQSEIERNGGELPEWVW